MFRSLLGLCLLLVALSGAAQGDGSLTKEFEHLSAKERARIAKKEQEESAKDAGYQGVMAAAEALFRQGQYDEALLRYQEARDLRPLNVYPKVKIQDLQALIAKRDAAAAFEAPVVTVPPVPSPPLDTASKAPSPARIEAPPPAAKPVPIPVEVKVTEKPRPEPSRPNTPAQRPTPVPARTKEPQVAGPDGVEERMYMEGRAVVMERKLTNNGRTEVYRRVTHPWGQVNYFRDGIATSERIWQEAGGER